MNSLNSIILEGNIVQEPVLRETSKGTHVCTFSIMCMRTYKQNENYEKEISFFNIDAWGKLAELSVKNGTKGRGVRIVGRLKQSRWVDPDEKNRSKISVVAEHVEFKPVFKTKAEEQGPKADMPNTKSEDTYIAETEAAYEQIPVF